MSIHKSPDSKDPLVLYCVENSLRLDPILQQLMEETKSHPRRGMAGAPEVIQLNQNLMRSIHAKRVLDIGVFTGISALAAALVIPKDGEVYAMDVTADAYNQHGKKFVDQAQVAHKIHFKVQPALKTLDELIAAGEVGKFDFAFIDALKTEYVDYYERCVKLLRSGGIIAVDNALWGGDVAQEPKDESTKAIDRLNKTVHGDDRVNCSLLNVGDGLMLAFKK